MPIIEGIGDEVLCVAVFAAPLLFLFRTSLWQGINAIQICFQGIWNGAGSRHWATNAESSRVISAEQRVFLMRMESPPENDCCSVCHDNFCLPCQANCAHWFCGDCILNVWHHSSALQPCKCPICRRPITLLIPCESANRRRNEPEVDSVLQNIERYNRLFGGGSVGFFQRLWDTPLLLRRLLRELMDPQRALPLVFRARIVFIGWGDLNLGLPWNVRITSPTPLTCMDICAFAFVLIYVFSPVDILPEGMLGLVGLLDDLLVILIVFFHVATLYRTALFYRHGGQS